MLEEEFCPSSQAFGVAVNIQEVFAPGDPPVGAHSFGGRAHVGTFSPLKLQDSVEVTGMAVVKCFGDCCDELEVLADSSAAAPP